MVIKKILSAFLVVVFLISSIYFMMPNDVKINIEKTKTKYYVWENNSWVLSATEYVNLFDGSAKMRAKSRELKYWNDSEFAYVQRISIWKDSIKTIQTYKFGIYNEDIPQFPMNNTFECFNCTGKIVHYEIRDILYNGETKIISSPFSFGYNMKIEWEDGSYYSKVFQQKYASDKIIIKYRPIKNYESYNVRLFDPPENIIVTLNSPADNLYSPTNEITFNCSVNITDGLSIKNVSLFSNITGVWQINETKSDFGDGNTYVYDEFDDSSINTTLWALTVGGDTSASETTEYMQLLSSSSNPSTSGNIKSRILPNYTVISEYNFETHLYTNLGFGVGGSQNTRASINFFGTTIKSIQANEGQTVTDDTNWTIIRNITVGGNVYEVYDDDVWQQQITGTNTNITFSTSITGGLSSSYTARVRTYYLNYTESLYLNTTEIFTKNITTETEWNCQSCNNNSECNMSVSNWTVFLDEQAPLVDIVYPTAINYSINVTELNYTASDENPDKCWYSIDNGASNSSVVAFGTNFTGLTSNEGDNNWTVYCNETNGLENNSLVSFFKDTIVPQIDYASNSDTSNSSGNFSEKDWVFINVSVQDVLIENITFWTWTSVNASFNKTVVTNNASSYWLNQTSLLKNVYFWNVTACDVSGQCNTTSIRYYGDEVVNFSINGTFGNEVAELGTGLNISATSTFDYVWIDVDHPDYGTNYSNGKWSTSFDLIINYFRKNVFNDSATSKVLEYTGTQIKTLYFTAHQYDEVDNMSINISGVSTDDYPENVLINKSNLSEIDRSYPGFLVGPNIYLNRTINAEGNKSLFYQNLGFQSINFYMDDEAKFVSFIFNITGIEYGFDFIDSFDNFSLIDKPLTTSQLDKSTAIMPANSTLTEFIFDDFEDGSVSSIWSKTADDSGSGSGWSYSKTISEVGGYIEMLNTWYNGGNVITGTGNLAFGPLANYTSLYITDSIEINISSQYDSNADNTGCSGNTYVYLGNSIAWTNWYVVDDDTSSNEIESSSANLIFNLSKENKTYWRVRISGVETSSAYLTDSCKSVYGTYNWTSGSYSVTKSDASCSDLSGTLDNDFFLMVDYEYANEFIVENIVNLDQATCKSNTINTKIYNVNKTLWNRTNSTTISEIIFSSSGDIDKATLNVTGDTAPNESIILYLSADDGTNWENVVSGVEHTFINTGKFIRWRADFVLNNSGFLNRTSWISKVNITTPRGFPTNISFDFGNDGTTDATFSGELNASNSPYTINITTVNLTSALNASPILYDHLISVPLKITSTVGQIDFNVFNLTYNPNPIKLNVTSILNFLVNSLNFINFPILIESIGGNITVNNIKYDYAGGNNTINVLAHNNDSSVNISRNITYYYSRWDYQWGPTNVDFLYFSPTSPNSVNVTPYGQTSSTPILNITNYGYGGKNATLSIYQNDTNSCVNTTISLNNSKDNGFLINESFITLGNLSYLDTIDIYMWADYNCSYSTWDLFEPQLYFRQCVDGGMCSTDLI